MRVLSAGTVDLNFISPEIRFKTLITHFSDKMFSGQNTLKTRCKTAENRRKPVSVERLGV